MMSKEEFIVLRHYLKEGLPKTVAVRLPGVC